MVKMHRITWVLALVASLSPGAAAQQTAAVRLTLEDAIQRGLRQNLGAMLAGTRIAEAQGTLQRREAALLPRARFEAPMTLQSRNLRAQGIDIPGMPDVVGPFTTYDFRVSADQSLLDLQLLHSKRAAAKQVEVAHKDYQQARNEVVRQIAGLYLAAESGSAQVVAAEARVRTAEALFRLASDQRDAGVATGIDVVRAEVRTSKERQTLVKARNAAQNALLVLSRAIGITPGTRIELTESLQKRSVTLPQIEESVRAALDGRSDYLAFARQREALQEQMKAAQSRYLPRLSVGGNYGGIGRTFSQIKGVGQAQMSLLFTLFDRDREGEKQQIQASVARVEEQMADLRLGIEQEIRQAVLNLESAEEELAVTEASVALAEKELDLARLRFQNGVTNNVELVNAQDSLSLAQQDMIVALTRHADARIALAYALGSTEQNYRQYLGSEPPTKR